jgi:hypothetical protein
MSCAPPPTPPCARPSPRPRPARHWRGCVPAAGPVGPRCGRPPDVELPPNTAPRRARRRRCVRLRAAAGVRHEFAQRGGGGRCRGGGGGRRNERHCAGACPGRCSLRRTGREQRAAASLVPQAGGHCVHARRAPAQQQCLPLAEPLKQTHAALYSWRDVGQRAAVWKAIEPP